jgi:preprotein translocase subunit SecF
MMLTLFKRQKWLISLLMPLLLISCHVMLTGAYNEAIDTSIQKVSADVSTLLVTLESNMDNNRIKENKYENFRESYIGILAELQDLKIRSQAQPKYEEVTKMIVALNQNVKDFESLHKTSFNSKPLLSSAATLMETSLVNLLATQQAMKRK